MILIMNLERCLSHAFKEINKNVTEQMTSSTAYFVIFWNLIFKLFVINRHLRKMLWGFKSKYDFLLWNRT